MKDAGGTSARGSLLTAPPVVLAGNAERHATISDRITSRLTGAHRGWLAVDPLSW